MVSRLKLQALGYPQGELIPDPIGMFDWHLSESEVQRQTQTRIIAFRCEPIPNSGVVPRVEPLASLRLLRARLPPVGELGPLREGAAQGLSGVGERIGIGGFQNFQYLSELNCSVGLSPDASSRLQVAEWLIQRAMDRAYAESEAQQINAQLYEKLAMEAQHGKELAETLAEMMSDAHLKAGIEELVKMVGLAAHPDQLTCLRALDKVIGNLVAMREGAADDAMAGRNEEKVGSLHLEQLVEHLG